MMFITAGLAIRARHARMAAEQRQREAASLVDFMLGDLNNKLRCGVLLRRPKKERIKKKTYSVILGHLRQAFLPTPER
jgi:hypothetical protein